MSKEKEKKKKKKKGGIFLMINMGEAKIEKKVPTNGGKKKWFVRWVSASRALVILGYIEIGRGDGEEKQRNQTEEGKKTPPSLKSL